MVLSLLSVGGAGLLREILLRRERTITTTQSLLLAPTPSDKEQRGLSQLACLSFQTYHH